MSRILILTDLSEGSFHAARFAIRAFDPGAHEFILIRSFMDLGDPLTPSSIEAMQRSMEQGLGSFEERLQALPEASHLQTGHLAFNGPLLEAVHQMTAMGDVEALVMGTRPEGRPLLLGSNTSSIIKHAGVPVIAVPTSWKDRPLDRILYADDLMDQERTEDLGPLVRIARRAGAEIVRMHIYPLEMLEKEEHPLRELAEADPRLGDVPHSEIYVHGDRVMERLMELLEDDRFGLVAVMHRRTGLWDGLMHRSTAKQLALHTRVPLLVMPG
ncbi:MAG: universal stress protein [Flavobacteriales bacterium]|nr:universal stress protein [Flavobacteriales bacterium]MCB9194126.1 universal stress protein [Flavobacteriales bacterium]